MVDNLTNAIVQLILNAQLVDHMDMKAMFLLALVCIMGRILKNYHEKSAIIAKRDAAT